MSGDEGSYGLPEPVIAHCRDAHLGAIVRWELLNGGLISVSRRITTTALSLVVKEAQNAPLDLYECEADGLRALADVDTLRTPQVLAVTPKYLFLEDLGSIPAGEGYWEAFGRSLALMRPIWRSIRYCLAGNSVSSFFTCARSSR